MSWEEWLIIVFWISFYFFFFCSSVGFFNLRNWFWTSFFWTPFSSITSVEEFLLIPSLYLHFFFFFYFWMQIEFLSILFSLSPFFFFCDCGIFTILYVWRRELSFLSILRRGIWWQNRLYCETRNEVKFLRIKARRFQIPFPFLERDPRGIKYCSLHGY